MKEKLSVQIQGIKGSFHHLAAKEYFLEKKITISECDTFRTLFLNLKEQPKSYGMCAIENNTVGAILPNYTYLTKSKIPIVGEIYLRIEHCLASSSEKIEGIKEVRSHYMALLQSSNFLNKHPNWIRTETNDTAESAKEIAEAKEEGVACVCSESAAKYYGLSILEKNIEDHKNNFTRFLVLGERKKEIIKQGKTSLVFSLSHDKGSLSSILSILASYDLNLTKIQSLPIVGKEWEYLFYIDLIFDDYEKLEHATQAIKPLVHEINNLGIYSVGRKIINGFPAERLKKVEEYYFSKKLKEISERNENGENILTLAIGSPDLLPDKTVLSALTEGASKKNASTYQPYSGTPELRKGFQKFYHEKYSLSFDAANEILPLMGSKEGIFYISMTYLNSGDSVLVPNPGYPTYSSVASMLGVNVRSYSLTEENDWQPEISELEDLLEHKTKLLWINYPHMPTGAEANEKKLSEIVRWAQKRKILICSDNPYSFIGTKTPRSIFQISGSKENCLELNSLSKSHNMAGWRVGCVIGKKEYIEEMLKVKSNIDTGMFRPIQEAAVSAMELPDKWFDDLNTEYKKRKEIASDIMKALGCQVPSKSLGLFLWCKISEKWKDSYEFSETVLEKAKIFLPPGEIFGTKGARYARISLCSSMEILNEALERVKKETI